MRGSDKIEDIEKTWDSRLVEIGRKHNIKNATVTKIVRGISSSEYGQMLFNVKEWDNYANFKQHRGSGTGHDLATIATTSSLLRLTKKGLVIEHNRGVDGKVLKYSFVAAAPLMDDWSTDEH